MPRNKQSVITDLGEPLEIPPLTDEQNSPEEQKLIRSVVLRLDAIADALVIILTEMR